jgi:ABC-type Fe3+/spermidine/putrescine transport system ATPase subunit
MISLKNITFEYDKNTIVFNRFNLNVSKGEIVAIKGKSGDGKSTILRLIAGLEKPESGEIMICNEIVNDLPANKRPVGYVFQSFALFPHLTVKKNIEFGIKEVSNKKDLVYEMAKKVGIEALLDRYPHEISGGQQQRVAIARSLIRKPKVLLLDEPFTALDEELKDIIRRDILRIIRKFNITTILVTHNIADAEALEARVVQL